MATATTGMGAVLVSNLTFYRPSRDGRWKSITVRTILGTILPLITLEGEYDEYRTPRFQGLGLIRSPSTHLDPTSTNWWSKQECKACVTQDPESFYRLILYITMVSRDGWPFSGHVTTTTSIAFDKTSPQRHPRCPYLLLPYKRAGRGLYKAATENGWKKTSHLPTIEDQHINQSPLYFHFLSETWDRFPLSQLVTPTQALKCKDIQYPLPAGRRAFFRLN
jgi:hypothetical protein